MTFLDIAFQVDLIVPALFVLGVIGSLIGVIYKMLNDKIKEQGIRIDKLEDRLNDTYKTLDAKLDKVLEIVNKLAVDQANSKSTCVQRSECNNCKTK